MPKVPPHGVVFERLVTGAALGENRRVVSDDHDDGARTPPLEWELSEEDRRFLRVYGRWDPFTPAEVAELMEGFTAPWWVIGGYAIEAFTGRSRFHEDIDLCCFDRDVQALRAQLGGRFHLWSNHGATFRVMDDERPEPLHPLSQVWMREDADSPWRMDFILNPATDDGRWTSRRKEIDLAAPLEEVTWVAGDGVRYFRPEYVLLYKAKEARSKDELDLETTWPLLGRERQAWLLDRLREFHSGHRWIERLTG